MYVVKKFYSKYYDTDEEVVVPEDFRDVEEIRYIGSPVTLVRSLY